MAQQGRCDGRQQPASTADTALVARVRAASANSDLHRGLMDTLHDLGIGRLTQFYYDNELPAQWARLGLGQPTLPSLLPSELRRIVHGTALDAAQRFVTHDVIGGNWDKDRDGSLVDRFTDECARSLAADFARFLGDDEPNLSDPTGVA